MPNFCWVLLGCLFNLDFQTHLNHILDANPTTAICNFQSEKSLTSIKCYMDRLFFKFPFNTIDIQVSLSKCGFVNNSYWRYWYDLEERVSTLPDIITVLGRMLFVTLGFACLHSRRWEGSLPDFGIFHFFPLSLIFLNLVLLKAVETLCSSHSPHSCNLAQLSILFLYLGLIFIQ